MSHSVRRLQAILIVICVFAIAAFSVNAAVPGEDFVAGWKFDGPALHFVGHDLYGHIDGGAELFHEFGFDSLIVQRYVKDKEELDLEIYQMSSHASAVGIYLMKVGRETPVEGVNCRNSGSASQLSLVRGALFVQINNFYGQDSLVPVMVAMANAVAEGTVEDPPVETFKLLADSGLIPGSARLIRGQYALQPVYTLGPGDILSLDGKIFGVVGKYLAPDSSQYTRIVVQYNSERKAASVFNNLMRNLDSYLKPIEKREDGLTFKDYQNKYGMVTLNGKILMCNLKLTAQPQLPQPEIDATGDASE